MVSLKYPPMLYSLIKERYYENIIIFNLNLLMFCSILNIERRRSRLRFINFLGKGKKHSSPISMSESSVEDDNPMADAFLTNRYDWFCDQCEANLNVQPGFYAGGYWVCTECGTCNDCTIANTYPRFSARLNPDDPYYLANADDAMEEQDDDDWY